MEGTYVSPAIYTGGFAVLPLLTEMCRVHMPFITIAPALQKMAVTPQWRAAVQGTIG